MSLQRAFDKLSPELQSILSMTVPTQAFGIWLDLALQDIYSQYRNLNVDDKEILQKHYFLLKQQEEVVNELKVIFLQLQNSLTKTQEFKNETQ